MLLGLFRRTAKRGTCACTQKNIRASRAHSQYTHLLTIMLCYLAQYSIVPLKEGCVQYYYCNTILCQFSPFHFRSLLSAWLSQLVAHPRSSARNPRLFQVWDLQEDTHYCRLQYDNYKFNSLHIYINFKLEHTYQQSYTTHLVMQCRYLHVHPV